MFVRGLWGAVFALWLCSQGFAEECLPAHAFSLGVTAVVLGVDGSVLSAPSVLYDKGEYFLMPAAVARLGDGSVKTDYHGECDSYHGHAGNILVNGNPFTDSAGYFDHGQYVAAHVGEMPTLPLWQAGVESAVPLAFAVRDRDAVSATALFVPPLVAPARLRLRNAIAQYDTQNQRFLAEVPVQVEYWADGTWWPSSGDEFTFAENSRHMVREEDFAVIPLAHVLEEDMAHVKLTVDRSGYEQGQLLLIIEYTGPGQRGVFRVDALLPDLPWYSPAASAYVYFGSMPSDAATVRSQPVF